jgi:hypothetical protein
VQPWSLATYKQLALDAEQPERTGVRRWGHIQLLGPGQERRRDELPYWGKAVGMCVCMQTPGLSGSSPKIHPCATIAQILMPDDPRLCGYIPDGYCGAYYYEYET